ncbi:hypothetical protein [Isachenkonia alkalipeptolytica]|uniref:Uncharacterized protein n=1 Tax=Isachenkonia alkalipeptolytica TaxID=2565777 RepID=A0AA43XK99_9CLOT|nr:hypothetical protein [Isachenkonia alkalipeptolytica]NBG87859.1 hypothetical protein [Isachenkonia alkalipeptolytica]
MKNKPALLITAAAIIILSVILMVANHLKEPDQRAEALENPSENLGNSAVEIIDIERSITGLESRMSRLEHQMPRDDLEQRIQSANSELDYVKDLLSKMPEIETHVGRISGYEIAEGTVLDVELKDTRELLQIPLAEDFTVYMMTELTWAPITLEDFNEFLQATTEGNKDTFTFKIIDGKAVQTFQGEKTE